MEEEEKKEEDDEGEDVEVSWRRKMRMPAVEEYVGGWSRNGEEILNPSQFIEVI